ncbi:NYN domain-containing protein [Marinivivus vitaminiproducens]|uniref:NYN domain-containing protein n=1 Tax=Marinivivus vitaminiproducens TaxID=3035935 RepID=UPI0027AAE968|nr:NYN domain-containing protein [Geminicoccaceae bacterium SCSIO 64248]
MLFIDGSWLHANLTELARAFGRSADFQIDFGKLAKVLTAEIEQQHGVGPVDLVRSHYFGSYADRYDLRDEMAARRRMSFFHALKEEFGYEVDAFPTYFHGRRLRASDRDPDDTFAPREKCVDVALSVRALRYAYMPGVMDLALFVIGDRDFVPLLQELRRMGKRVAIASIEGSCADALWDPADNERVRDGGVIWLNDLASRIELRGDRRRPQRRPKPEEGYGLTPGLVPHPLVVDENGDTVETAEAQGMLRGTIKNIIWDRGYGFIAAEDGRDYFFHANALEESLPFEDIQPEMSVLFEVKTGPTPGRAGAARAVYRNPEGGRAALGSHDDHEDDEEVIDEDVIDEDDDVDADPDDEFEMEPDVENDRDLIRS